MFFLQGINLGILVCKKGRNTVGRISGDIVIKDSSVSRNHAEIEERNGSAFLRDCNSKYFTKHNGRLLVGNEEVKLQEGDRISFGEVKFRFHIGETLVVCSTGAKERERNIAKMVNKLGGELLKDWDDSCTHLTTSEILITLKVLHAIMDNKKIVVPHYWEVYLQNITSGQLPPDAASYYPPLGESIINSSYVKYNPDRNTVFGGKTFAFWSKKKQSKIESIIRKAGGKCINLGEITNENELSRLMRKCIVIDPEDAIIEQKYSAVIEKYKDSGKRMIPVQEIVMAILQCSCKENCNPTFNRARTVFLKESQKHGSSIPIVPETQSQQFYIETDVKPYVIPASLEPEICVPSQRNDNKKLEGSVSRTVNETQLMAEEIELPAKRIKLDAKVEIIKEVELSIQRENDSSNRTIGLFKRVIKEDSPPPAKRLKKDMKINPFAAIASTSKENPYNSIAKEEEDELDLSDNPFGRSNLFKSVEVKSESVEDTSVEIVEEHPANTLKNQTVSKKTVSFANPKVTSKTGIESSKKLGAFEKATTLNYSNMKHDVSSGQWMNSSVMVNDDSKIPSSQDEEERKWCEKFSNSVVIVMKDLLRKDWNNREPVISQVSSRGGQVKNFKKFQKVPVPKSSLMIKCSRFVFGGSNLGVDYGQSDDENNRDI